MVAGPVDENMMPCSPMASRTPLAEKGQCSPLVEKENLRLGRERGLEALLQLQIESMRQDFDKRLEEVRRQVLEAQLPSAVDAVVGRLAARVSELEARLDAACDAGMVRDASSLVTPRPSQCGTSGVWTEPALTPRTPREAAEEAPATPRLWTPMQESREVCRRAWYADGSVDPGERPPSPWWGRPVLPPEDVPPLPRDLHHRRAGRSRRQIRSFSSGHLGGSIAPAQTAALTPPPPARAGAQRCISPQRPCETPSFQPTSSRGGAACVRLASPPFRSVIGAAQTRSRFGSGQFPMPHAAAVSTKGAIAVQPPTVAEFSKQLEIALPGKSFTVKMVSKPVFGTDVVSPTPAPTVEATPAPTEGEEDGASSTSVLGALLATTASLGLTSFF